MSQHKAMWSDQGGWVGGQSRINNDSTFGRWTLNRLFFEHFGAFGHLLHNPRESWP
jgi:hypothetical protein